MLPGLVVFRRTGVSTEAAEDANRGVRLAATQLLKSDPYANSSRVRRMSEFARSLLRGKRSYEDYELAVQIAIAQGSYGEALAFQEKALAVFEGSEEEAAELYLRMGYLYVLLGEFEKALSWLDLGVAVKPYVEPVLTRAQVRLNLGDVEGALTDVDACLEAVGDSLTLLPDMVNIYGAAGEYEKAVELWTRLLDTGEAEDYRLDRAFCYVQLGRMGEAEDDVQRYLERRGENAATANAVLAMGFLRSGEYVKADEYFARALSGEDSDPYSLYYYIVLCAYLTGKYERACEYGEGLLERLERGEDAGAAQLSVEDVSGRLQVELVPADIAQLGRMVGASHMMLGEFRRAAEVLTLSLREKDDAAVRYLRGSSLLAQERFGEALEDFEAALAAGVQTESSRYSAGVCRMQLGELPEALEAFDWVARNGEDPALREEAARQAERLRAAEENNP